MSLVYHFFLEHGVELFVTVATDKSYRAVWSCESRS